MAQTGCFTFHNGDNLKKLQRYVANIGISGSSLRNQGAPGVVATARAFLAELKLAALRDIALSDYPAWLERTTNDLVLDLPKPARKWGVARKAINIFTTQAFLNIGLATTFRLTRLGDAMETPLDGGAATELRRLSHEMPGAPRLPAWRGVRDLTRHMSQDYQDFALVVARKKRLPRACLDIILFRPLAG